MKILHPISLFSPVSYHRLFSNFLAQNSITGIVFDNNRRPVADITVELLDEFERLIRQTSAEIPDFINFQSFVREIITFKYKHGWNGF